MKYFYIILLGCLTIQSCKKNKLPSSLESYIADQENFTLKRDDIIACAAGNSIGLPGSKTPTSIFFYPVSGATEFKYFEAEQISDSCDFSKYAEKYLTDEPVFNGYLWKFNNTQFDGERMGIVSYKTGTTLHICTPIRLKTNVKPTEVNPDLLIVNENSTTPSFSWSDGLINENVIYFQVISDTLGNLISGTYTYQKEFTFYDLSNVVLNIKDTNPAPSITSNSQYKITLMAVSEDNWVNLLGEKLFSTD